jgi:hypothetical protein
LALDRSLSDGFTKAIPRTHLVQRTCRKEVEPTCDKGGSEKEVFLLKKIFAAHDPC